ncbi:unnamed protein product [Darwinula stevensoni]|uniref:Uncharacterized protein n=1 Tax=Darwinula stevensoni TaxID=69355 RepID=A0A7R8XA43_9CRUS|nr:unnamed protein product [Darwinula stevensoni]CAG0889844.1 unnamed protein product [Darwinula stevensoni]
MAGTTYIYYVWTAGKGIKVRTTWSIRKKSSRNLSSALKVPALSYLLDQPSQMLPPTATLRSNHCQT